MSSYNENLRASVAALLESRQLEIKKIEAVKNASMLTLHYAEGAAITAADQHNKAVAAMHKKSDVKEQAAIVSNTSANLLNTFIQANQYFRRSATDISVAAASVQSATNAIVRLAGDLGSIYNIVNAADANTDMYQLSKEACELINQTAFDAEGASQTAMEAASLTAGVTASTLQDKAKNTDGLAAGVLKMASDEFEVAVQYITSHNTAVANAGNTQKQAEGNYDDVRIAYKAAKSVYTLANKELNLNLTVLSAAATHCHVHFDPIKDPFDSNPVKPGYPVDDYNLIIVKEEKKAIFSIANAEDIALNGYDPVSKTVKYVPVTIPLPSDGSGVVVDFKKVIIRDLSGSRKTKVVCSLQDADGDAIKPGQNYVVFLMARYCLDYKKRLNCFDDYLSAASLSFTFSHTLAAVEGSSIVVDRKNPHQLHFTVTENADLANEVAYRAIFLPLHNPATGNMAGEELLTGFDNTIQQLEDIANTYDPLIAEAQAVIAERGEGKKSLTSLIARKNAAIKKVNAKTFGTPGFLFNRQLAENVLPGNFTTAIRVPSATAKTTSTANAAKYSRATKSTWRIPVTAATTDNFGNLLVPGLQYVPVVLSLYNGPEEKAALFCSACSDYTGSRPYVYQPDVPAPRKPIILRSQKEVI